MGAGIISKWMNDLKKYNMNFNELLKKNLKVIFLIILLYPIIVGST